MHKRVTAWYRSSVSLALVLVAVACAAQFTSPSHERASYTLARS